MGVLLVSGKNHDRGLGHRCQPSLDPPCTLPPAAAVMDLRQGLLSTKPLQKLLAGKLTNTEGSSHLVTTSLETKAFEAGVPLFSIAV